MIEYDPDTGEEYLKAEVTSRIVAATALGDAPPGKMKALGVALARAYFSYVGWRMGDIEPTAAAKKNALGTLRGDAIRFRKAIERFEQQGRPGLALLSQLRPELLASLKADYTALTNDKLNARRNGREVPPGLESHRFQLDQDLIYTERNPPEAILNQMMRSLRILISLLDLVERTGRRDKGDLYNGWVDDPEHVAALRWLIKEDLPEIYEKTFNRERGFAKGDKPEPNGPLVRFVSSCLTEFGINSAKGTPLTAHAIAEYWRPDRKRVRTKSRPTSRG